MTQQEMNSNPRNNGRNTDRSIVGRLKGAAAALALLGTPLAAMNFSHAREFGNEPTPRVASLDNERQTVEERQGISALRDVSARLEGPLAAVCKDLETLRFLQKWSGRSYKPSKTLSRTGFQSSVADAKAAFAAVRGSEPNEVMTAILDRADKHIENVENVARKIANRERLTQDDLTGSHEARSFLMGLGYAIDDIKAADAGEEMDMDALEDRIQRTNAVILSIDNSPCSGSIAMGFSNCALLMDLNSLSQRQRENLARLTIEDDTTKVLDITSRNERGQSQPVLYVKVEKVIKVEHEGRELESKIQFTLRQTSQPVNTGDRLGILLGTNTAAGVVVRNSMVEEEVAISPIIRLTGYDTVTTFFSNPANRRGSTVANCTLDMEMTFSRMTADEHSEKRDIAAANAEEALQAKVDLTLEKTKANMTRLVRSGSGFLR